MSSERQAERAARRVLDTGPGDTEADISQRIVKMLTALEHDDRRLEFGLPAGRADIYLPRLRTIIEVKRSGLADSPDEAPPGRRSPFQQLDGYLKSAIAAERKSCFGSDGGRRWRGILTDGRVWHSWSWEHRRKPAAQEEQRDFRPANEGELAAWVQGQLSGDPVGKPWIPSNPVGLFRDQAHELRKIHDDLPGDVARETLTKRGLWGDMLRSSGMYPATGPARDRLFVSHSFLVTLARGVIWSMSGHPGEPDPGQLLEDGFVSWIVQTSDGRGWAEEILKQINEYDWRMRQGDVLRPLYEAFVDARERRDFGEVYTPDWLAELIVRETLDDEWCSRAIEAAQEEYHNNEPLQGIGVLDPACGSGTFLYHAVRRLLAHKDMPDEDGERSRVAARLVNGIDIHPVACEFAKATLLRAMPGIPTALRVYNGDSLQLQGGEDGSLFATSNGDIEINSPGGTGMISLPGSFVERKDLARLVKTFTETALNGDELPRHVRNSAAEEDRQSLDTAHEELRKIIRREGNSVWAWYITNAVGPYALARHKVDRIVSNPPWVKIAFISVRERHRRLREEAVHLRLWAGGKNAANFDLAQVFVKKCRQTFLADPAGNPASWVVKASALKAQHWERLRQWRDEAGIAGQSIDLIDVQVFGGGDAKRSCLLFDVVNTTLGAAPVLVGRCPAGRPGHGSSYDEAMGLIEWGEPRPPIPAGRSHYDRRGFRRGADLFPHVLVVVELAEPSRERGQVDVTTKPSVKRPWSAVQPQQVSIPRRWMVPVINTEDMLAFALRPGRSARAIVPVRADGRLLTHASAMQNEGWQQLEELYAEHRGHGQGTPPTLTARINHGAALEKQLPLGGRRQNTPPTRVLYPNSGDIMRGCRCNASQGIVTGGLVHATFATAAEAAYLTALLNAPALRAAFRQSRTSNRDFALNPWQRVPIPEFDPGNDLHRELAGLAVEAEAAAMAVLDDLMDEPADGQRVPGQVAISKRIRSRLADAGIAGRIDAAALRLLPEQTRAI